MRKALVAALLLVAGLLVLAGAVADEPVRAEPVLAGDQAVARDTAVFAGGCFWCMEPPFDELDSGQFCDRGFSYTTAIFARDPEQLRQGRASKEAVQDRFSQKVVTPVVQDTTFYAAEEYHQDYYEKNSIRYEIYRWNCGRDDRLDELWGRDAA